MNRPKYTTLLLFFTIAFIASFILAFVSLEKACGISSATCNAVQTSGYESTAGIKNSALGIIAFSILGLITLFHIKKPTKRKKQIIFVGTVISSAIAIYFLYLQFFVIKAICKYCMIADASILLNLGIVLFWKEIYSKN